VIEEVQSVHAYDEGLQNLSKLSADRSSDGWLSNRKGDLACWEVAVAVTVWV
jgi:hypothetical protein